jgi:hypothetical protein
MTLNMLRRSRFNPRLSAHTQIFGVFDYNRTPLAPIGTRTVVHERTTQQGRTTFSNHGSTTPSNSETVQPPRVSERTMTVQTPRVNTVQAGSPLVENDPKSPQVAVRGAA